MSWVIAAPEYVAAAAGDLAGIASSISAANTAAAFPTSAVLPSGADEVSAAISALFSAHAEAYQALSAQAAMFHDQFVQLMTAGAGQYAAAEAANAVPMQPAQALSTDSGQAAMLGGVTNPAAGATPNSGSPLVSGATGAAAAAGGPAAPLRPGGTGIAAAAAAGGPAGRAAALSGTGGGDASGAGAGSASPAGLLFGPGALGAANATGGANGAQDGGHAAIGLPVAHEGWIYGDGYGGTGASLADHAVAAHGGLAPLDATTPSGFTAPAGHVTDGTNGVGGQMSGQPAGNAST